VARFVAEKSEGNALYAEELAFTLRETGTLVVADGEAITIATEDGEHRIPLAEVASARTVLEWGAAAPKKGKK